jgi:AraC-like DNA-binding protein
MPAAIRDALEAIVSGTLANASNIVEAQASLPGGVTRTGFHCHDGWEIFVPLGEQLRFQVAGRPPSTIAAGRILLVRPGCLHLAIHLIPQRPKLRVLFITLPQAESPFGGIALDAHDRPISPAELTTWTALVRDTPDRLMTRVAEQLERPGFARQRALSDLRLLISALGEILFGGGVRGDGDRDDGVARAQAILHREYYRQDLDVDAVAGMVGMSPSHLSRMFKRRSGKSIHRTLIDIRLRRARELLTDDSLSIKEVATLTGWSNQLYFSSVFRRNVGVAPSRARGLGGR